MEIKLTGEMSLADVRQVLFEKLHELESEYAVRFSRGATLYINPTNGKGTNVTPRTSTGAKLNKLFSTGPYRSAADDYKL